jgi:dinuclear metal center YbgI/SA1388 family protein
LSPRVQNIVYWLNDIAPPTIKEEWDNVGLQVGDLSGPVKKVMVALTVTEAVIAQAVSNNVDILVAHHPLIYHPISSLRFDDPLGRMISELIRHQISLYIAHTNYDAAPTGTSYLLAQILGLQDHEVLQPSLDVSCDSPIVGLGRIGRLPEPMKPGDFLSHLCHTLKIPGLRHSGSVPKEVINVAVLGGSGKSHFDCVVQKGADVYITGDIDFHTAIKAQENKIWLIDTGHFHTEKQLITYWKEYLTKKAGEEGLDITVLAAWEEDPFRLYIWE